MKVLLTMYDRELPIAIPFFIGRTYHPPENKWFANKLPAVP
jgi:hypothetical protein